MGRKKYFAASVAGSIMLLCVVLAVVGGPIHYFDQAAINALAAERLAHPALTHAGIRITQAGGAQVTLTLTLLGAALLMWHGRRFDAAALVAIVLGGRLVVDVLKQLIARPRPDLDLQAVTVQSLSFPSGHAANSMIAFVAVALFCTTEQRRKAALALAIIASLAVGATRPLLGVHWPSDVVAGWIFGLLWTVGWWRILATSSRGIGTGRAALPLFLERRGKMTPTPRDPAEQALIEDAESLPTPSQSGGTGGDMARNVGSRDELARGTGKDSGVTRVHKGDKPDDGDEPNLPNRA